MTLTLTLPKGEFVYSGRQVTFSAPCESEGLTGVIVDGVTYALVSAKGTTLVANSFDSGAMVSVIFDVEKRKAYVQNADTNAYLEEQLGNRSEKSHTHTAQDVGAAPASHASSTTNPHGVTKAQVGLGNVPNVSTNDQTPTYTQASTLANLTSGEKLSVSLGKIMKAIADFITHIGNKSNPHSVTASQVGAVPTSRTVNGKALSADVTLGAGDVGASPTGHTHDDRYYTETEVNSLLGNKANSSHGNHVPTTGTADNATFLRNDNTWQKVTPSNIGASPTGHKHTKSEITDFPSTMPPAAHNHSASEINSGTFSSDRLPTVPVTKGGTGATTAEAARTNLGITPANIGAAPAPIISTNDITAGSAASGAGSYHVIE